LLNCVMFTVPVTPVFMPVKLKESARAVALIAITESIAAKLKSILRFIKDLLAFLRSTVRL
jgi:hypothetical protein